MLAFCASCLLAQRAVTATEVSDVAVQLSLDELRMIERSEVEVLREAIRERPEIVNASSYRVGKCTALAYAAALGHLEVVKMLSEEGADVEKTCAEGEFTPLMMAVLCSEQFEVYHDVCPRHLKHGKYSLQHLKTVKVLLASNASLAPTDEEGRTSLHLAALNGNEQVIDELLKSKNSCPVDVLDNHGWSPLLYAVQRNDGTAVELLARVGANINIQDASGFSAADHAKHLGHKSVLQKLIDLGAKTGIQQNQKDEL